MNIFLFAGKLLDKIVTSIMGVLYPIKDLTDLPYLEPKSTPEASNAPTSAYTPPTAPIPAETITTSSAPKPTPNGRIMLQKFCGAIRDFEGKPGDLNYQLNNPGDCRPSPVGYLPKYEPVEIIDTDTDQRYLYHKGKFAKFPTYELGWEYLQAMVHFIATNHPTWTILDFFQHFAPTSDNNAPVGYANNVAKRCGVSSSTTMKQLFG